MKTNGLNEILKLSIAERILAVEAIWDSIVAEKNEFSLSKEDIKTLDERYEAYKKNPEDAKTWEEVKSNILKKL